MNKFVLPILALALLLGASTAHAQNSQRIAAVVNEDVISVYDLDTRLSLVIKTSQLPNRGEVRRRIAPQVLRRLIDERIQMQEARRLDIEVTEADVERALSQIARQNNVPSGRFDEFLQTEGVDKLALVNQIEPEIAWGKVVRRRLRPSIRIGEEEVEEALDRLRASEGQPEYRLAQIFLRVDNPTNESEVQQVAERLMEQLAAGASFAALARSFSQDASAGNGGSIGWVRQSEVPTDLQPPLAQLRPGEVAGPIRTLGGFYILFMRDQRVARGIDLPEVTVEMQQLFLPITETATEADAAEQIERARALGAQANSCEDMERIAGELGTPMSGSLGQLTESSLPPTLQNVVRGLEIGHASEPVRTDVGIVVLMICQREGGEIDETIRERIENLLVMQRMDIAARRYLRDLRRAAFIDVRLSP